MFIDHAYINASFDFGCILNMNAVMSANAFLTHKNNEDDFFLNEENKLRKKHIKLLWLKLLSESERERERKCSMSRCCCCDMKCRVRVKGNNERPELVRNTTSKHISFGCCSVTYAWCFWWTSVEVSFFFGSLRFFFFLLCLVVIVVFVSFYCKFSCFLFGIQPWLGLIFIWLEFLFFSFNMQWYNVTQPQWFLVGIFVVATFFSEFLLMLSVRYEHAFVCDNEIYHLSSVSLFFPFHFQVIHVDLLVQVQNVKKILIYYFFLWLFFFSK